MLEALAAVAPRHSAGLETSGGGAALSIGLSAVIVAATVDEPRVLTIRLRDGDTASDALPSGPLEAEHRTLEVGLRAWVERQTSQRLGYVEQLYTFGDRDRVGIDPDAALPRAGGRLCGAGARGAPRRIGRSRMARLVPLFPVGGSGGTASRRGLTRSKSAWRPGQVPAAMPNAGCASCGSILPLACMARPGTRSWSSSAMSCSTRPASLPRQFGAIGETR